MIWLVFYISYWEEWLEANGAIVNATTTRFLETTGLYNRGV